MKIAFCFLTIDNTYYPQIWLDYFKDNYDKLNIYSHPKYPEQVEDIFLKENIIKKLVPTKWGAFTNAYLNLYEEAYKNPDNEFFIIVSESCLPVKSFNNFYNFLQKKYNKDNKVSFLYHRKYDDFNIKKSKLSKKYLNNIKLIKHSGWFVLSRYHIKKLLSHPDRYKFNNIIAGDEHILSLIYDSHFINYQITYDDWTYSEPIIKELNEKLAYLYYLKENLNIDTDEEILKLRIAKSDIGKHPYVFDKITDIQLKGMKISESFFYRKFSRNSDIINYYKKLIEG